MRQWFRFDAKVDDSSVVDIYIIDVIGSWDDDWFARNFGYDMGVTARAFTEKLAALPEGVKTLNVHINSPGGDVQGGVNIANALREQQLSKNRTVETFIDGIAASTASVIAMAGSKVHIADNALVMVHNPWTIGIGNADEMRKLAGILDTIRTQIVNTYKWHSSLDEKALEKLMDAETWMDADEALANGLATHKVEGLKAAALIDKRGMASLKIPEKFKARVLQFVKPEPETPPAADAVEVMRLCREGEVADIAESLVKAKATLTVVKTTIEGEKTKRSQAADREREIRGLCATAQLPELADGYVKGQMSVDDVRAHLTTVTAKVDKTEIDGSLKPDQGKTKHSLNPADIYAERNKKTA